MVARLLDASLFAAAALVCLGLALAMAYESWALASGAAPTISDILASGAFTHPVWARIGFFAAGLVVGGLAVYFGGYRP